MNKPLHITKNQNKCFKLLVNDLKKCKTRDQIIALRIQLTAIMMIGVSPISLVSLTSTFEMCKIYSDKSVRITYTTEASFCDTEHGSSKTRVELLTSNNFH